MDLMVFTEVTINRSSDQEVLFSYSDDNIINWREDTEFVRPKWGIYRSLINAQDLRDEEVLYSDFSIEELEALSSQNVKKADISYSNLISENLIIENLPTDFQKLQIFSIDGKLFIDSNIQDSSKVNLNVAFLQPGIYVVRLLGKHSEQTEMILIH